MNALEEFDKSVLNSPELKAKADELGLVINIRDNRYLQVFGNDKEKAEELDKFMHQLYHKKVLLLSPEKQRELAKIAFPHLQI